MGADPIVSSRFRLSFSTQQTADRALQYYRSMSCSCRSTCSRSQATKESDRAQAREEVQAQGCCPRPDFPGLRPDFPVGQIFRPVVCSLKIAAEYLFFTEDDTGFQKGVYSGVSAYFGSMAYRSLFCVFWVICMVHFQFAFGGCLCLHQVDGVEDRRAPRASQASQEGG